nr:unnamed protein product [Callosobruchus chinensis]
MHMISTIILQMLQRTQPIIQRN